MAKVDNMGGNPQDCQPQDCLLVNNPEVGNSEYIHYSGLPTPIIHRNSVMVGICWVTMVGICHGGNMLGNHNGNLSWWEYAG